MIRNAALGLGAVLVLTACGGVTDKQRLTFIAGLDESETLTELNLRQYGTDEELLDLGVRACELREGGEPPQGTIKVMERELQGVTPFGAGVFTGISLVSLCPEHQFREEEGNVFEGY